MFPSREGYNQLATNLAFSRSGKPPQVVVVTSPLPGEGKSTVAMNLAVTLAQSGTRVLLIDADLRRGVMAAALGITQEPGLAEVLSGSVPPLEARQALRVSDREFLDVIPCGRSPQNPPALLGTELASLLSVLRTEYETIILDTPPVNVVADVKLAAVHSDGVVLVARAGVTSIEALTFANEELRHVGAPVLGAVLNRIDFRRDASYDEAYQYYARGAVYTGETE
jgi:capsular exopolysaccharide synthesis family protein